MILSLRGFVVSTTGRFVLIHASLFVLVLGSFQCRDVLLLWHMVGRGLMCLQQVRDGCAIFYFIFVFISSILSSFSNASSVGRRLDILKYCGLGRYNPAVVVTTTGGVLAK